MKKTIVKSSIIFLITILGIIFIQTFVFAANEFDSVKTAEDVKAVRERNITPEDFVGRGGTVETVDKFISILEQKAGTKERKF